MKLSATALNTYLQCPRKYWHQKIDRTNVTGPPPDRTALQFGLAVHKAFELAALRGGQPTVDAMHRDWLDAINGQLDSSEFSPRARRIFVRFCAREDPFGACESVEQRFDLALPNGAPIVGAMDRVDRSTRSVVIVDYKTGKVPRDEHFRESIQPDVYAWAAHQLYPEAIAICVLFEYVEHGKNKPVSYGHERIQAVEDKLITLSDMLKVAHAEPTIQLKAQPSPLCGWCDYGPICDAYGEGA